MKTLTGVVVSKKLKSTVTVKVERQWRHPMYGKIVRKSKKYLVHDEMGVGLEDRVRIMETRPLSKRKRFKVVEKLEKGKRVEDKGEGVK